MLKLYGVYRSRVFRIAWLLLESDIPYEHINTTIGVEGATCKDPAYVALNPNARVPTIDDDGVVVWESAAINLYLAEKYNSPLWPKDMQAKARLYQWTFFIANDIEPPLITIMRTKGLTARALHDQAAASAADVKMQPYLKVLDDHLAKHKYFAGDAWGLADLMAAGVCFLFVVMKYDLSKYPSLEKWLLDSIDRPKAKEAIALRA